MDFWPGVYLQCVLPCTHTLIEFLLSNKAHFWDLVPLENVIDQDRDFLGKNSKKKKTVSYGTEWSHPNTIK